MQNPRLSVLAAAVSVLALGSLAHAQIGTELVADGLAEPLFLTQPAGDGRLFVLERAGRIRVIDGSTLQATPYLDIATQVDTDGEGGLLGMAFAPDFASSGTFYLNYTTPSAAPSGMDTVIERFTVSNPADPTAGSATRQTVLRIAQPFNNHNAGWIGFAPGDATGQYLYIPTGDGGSSNDPGNRAQDLSTLLGKVLRLDVSGADDFPGDNTRNYAIPADNFFAADGDGNTLGEIIAYGLRNPYRNSFDRATGDLYLGDVGQGAREEVSLLPAGTQGQNFGWRIREGSIDNPNVGGSLDPSLRTDPIFDYAHGSALLDGANGTITGGYVYRGSALGEEYQGLYFFGDFITGKFFTIDPEAANIPASLQEITDDLFPGGFGSFDLVSFGEDTNGELYVVDRDGQIYQIVPEPASAALLLLSALGLMRRRTRAA